VGAIQYGCWRPRGRPLLCAQQLPHNLALAAGEGSTGHSSRARVLGPENPAYLAPLFRLCSGGGTFREPAALVLAWSAYVYRQLVGPQGLVLFCYQPPLERFHRGTVLSVLAARAASAPDSRVTLGLPRHDWAERYDAGHPERILGRSVRQCHLGQHLCQARPHCPRGSPGVFVACGRVRAGLPSRPSCVLASS